MANFRSKKQSDLEKRLKLLRQQVYGKIETPEISKSTHSASADITYLSPDLIKILTLSSLAIGIQVILFLLVRNHILNLNFF